MGADWQVCSRWSVHEKHPMQGWLHTEDKRKDAIENRVYVQ